MKTSLIRALLGTVLLLTVGCNQSNMAKLGLTASGNNSLSNLVVPQAPKIHCDISAGATLIRSIDTITANDVSIQNPVEKTMLSFDCSKTSDAAPASALKFEVSFDTSVPGLSTVSKNFTYSFNNPGQYAMKVRVTDPEGLVTDKDFTMIVQCDGSHPALAINSTKLTVVGDGNIGFFNYGAAGAVSGGTGNYQYQWDFNGDGTADAYTMAPAAPINWVSQTSLTHIYTNFSTNPGTTRNVTLNVRDTVCNFVASKDVAIDFSAGLPRIPASQAAADEKAYYYIQADIAGLSGNADKSANNMYTATNLPTEPQKYVVCSYNKSTMTGMASFQIKGLNTYDDGTNPNLIHGMRLNIQNINDNGGTTEQVFSATAPGQANAPDLNVADYYTAEGSDTLAANDYNKGTTFCPVTIRVKRASAVVPCADGATIQSDVVIIRGEFSCPSMTAANSKKVSAQNGYYYCQVAYSNQCPGGGGQGGGGIPPIPK